jgi:hypothetical protein
VNHRIFTGDVAVDVFSQGRVSRCTCTGQCGTVEVPEQLHSLIENVPEHYMCPDTYWAESFNHQLLTYLPKQIHFSTATFEMRNENVNCPSTSERQVRNLCRPDRHSPIKVLVKKSYRFMEKVWPRQQHYTKSMTGNGNEY